MSRFVTFLACCLIPISGALAQVQTQAQLDRFQRQLDQIQLESRTSIDNGIPVGDRVLVDYGAYLSSAYLSLNDPQLNSHQLGQFEAVGYGLINIDGAHEFYARFHSLYNDYFPGDEFDATRDDYVTPRLERAYYRFDLARDKAAYHGETTNDNLVFTGGRQLVTWANGLTFDEVIDGITTTFSRGPVSLDVVAGVTAKFVTDFDPSRPDFRTNTHRGFYGGMLTTRLGNHHLFAYGLVQHDYNGDDTLVSNGITTRFGYNSYYIGIGSNGNLSDNLLYGVEAVYEGGDTLSNSFDPATLAQVTQTRDKIEAYAVNAKLDYVLATERRTRLGAELIIAGGDHDRLSTNTTFGGNLSGTKDHAFNGFGLLNTGLAFAPAVSNVVVTRVGASTFPFIQAASLRQMQVGTDLLLFNKLVESGPIDEPTSDHRYLGTEGDIYVNWPILSDVTLAVRYGVFIPGSAITSSSGARQFIYTGLTYAF